MKTYNSMPGSTINSSCEEMQRLSLEHGCDIKTTLKGEVTVDGKLIKLNGELK